MERKILFHFTGLDKFRGKLKSQHEAFDTLKTILDSMKFKLSENIRSFTMNDRNGCSGINNIPIKMSCFTETHKDHIESHAKTFGKFGIGMKLEWAIRKGAIRVIYYDNRHPNILGETLEEIYGKFFIQDKLEMNTPFKWDHTIAGITENINFVNESEWRFLKKDFDNDKTDAVKFQKKDVACFVLPRTFGNEFRSFLEKHKAFRVNSPELILI